MFLPQNGLPSILIISCIAWADIWWCLCCLTISSTTEKMSAWKPWSGWGVFLIPTALLATSKITFLAALIWLVLRRTGVSEEFYKAEQQKNFRNKFSALIMTPSLVHYILALEAVLLLVSTKNRDLWPGPNRKSTIHGLPITLCMLKVKSDKSDCFWSQSIVSTKPFKPECCWTWTRGRDSWCWQKGKRALGTRMLYTTVNYAKNRLQCSLFCPKLVAYK